MKYLARTHLVDVSGVIVQFFLDTGILTRVLIRHVRKYLACEM
jgi:hypothetical protein